MSGQHPIDALTAVERRRAVKHTMARIVVDLILLAGLARLLADAVRRHVTQATDALAAGAQTGATPSG